MASTAFSPPLLILLGQGGAGKTTVALALVDAADRQTAVTLVDLDVSSPYFRSSDWADSLAAAGISLLAPRFSGGRNTLEVPSLPPHMDAEIQGAGMLDPQGRRRSVILDVGGDEIGARVLGRYRQSIASTDHAVYYILNPFCAGAAEITTVREHLRSCERAAGLFVTALIANPHLGAETTPAIIADGLEQIHTMAGELSLPVAFFAAAEQFSSALPITLPFLRIQTMKGAEPLMKKITLQEDRCKGCLLCASVCPKNVLEPSTNHPNSKGYFSMCAVREEDCISCGQCALICPDCVICVYRGD